jgi:hypothetical protein
MQDPEQQQEPERWDEPILASSPEEAKKQCKRRAESYGVTLESVTEPKTIQNRKQVYRCNYVTEGDE